MITWRLSDHDLLIPFRPIQHNVHDAKKLTILFIFSISLLPVIIVVLDPSESLGNVLIIEHYRKIIVKKWAATTIEIFLTPTTHPSLCDTLRKNFTRQIVYACYVNFARTLGQINTDDWAGCVPEPSIERDCFLPNGCPLGNPEGLRAEYQLCCGYRTLWGLPDYGLLSWSIGSAAIG